jgi:hypothetical protein
MKSVLFILASVVLFNSNALAQRGGGETRGSSSSGETHGSSDGGSSRGSDYDTRSSSSSSSDNSSSSSSSSSDNSSSSSSSSCCDSGGYSSGGYSGGSRSHKPKVTDFYLDQKVELISTGDQGVITYIRKTLFGGYVCIEFDVDHTEECGFKAKDVRAI